MKCVPRFATQKRDSDSRKLLFSPERFVLLKNEKEQFSELTVQGAKLITHEIEVEVEGDTTLFAAREALWQRNKTREDVNRCYVMQFEMKKSSLGRN